MAHLREQIREQIVSTITGLASGATVYKGRVYPMEQADLPALLVYDTGESQDLETRTMGSGRKTFRNLNIVIEIQVQGTSNAVDDSADTICAEVETALHTDYTVGGLAYDSYLTSTSKKGDGTGNKYIVIAEMNFEITYRTTELDPTAKA